jgi:hypothetical protein
MSSASDILDEIKVLRAHLAVENDVTVKRDLQILIRHKEDAFMQAYDAEEAAERAAQQQQNVNEGNYRRVGPRR